MFAASNKLMEEVRRALAETASGPEQPGTIPGSHGASLAGAGGAVNIEDTEDALDLLLQGIVSSIVDETGATEEEAISFVFDTADEMAENGELPTMPDDDASAEEIAAWLGAANTVQFGAQVLKDARDEMAD